MTLNDPNWNPKFEFTIGIEAEITAEDLGKAMANSDNIRQAALWGWFADAIVKWPPDWSWVEQSRRIAERMSDEECQTVADFLETFVSELRSTPTRRAIETAQKTIGQLTASALDRIRTD